jgi:hypothetical protein
MATELETISSRRWFLRFLTSKADAQALFNVGQKIRHWADGFLVCGPVCVTHSQLVLT